MYLLLRQRHDDGPPSETPMTARNSSPYKPGDLTAAPGPTWGQARVVDAHGHGATLVSSSQATANALAQMAADHPRVVAKLAATEARADRLADALGRVVEVFNKTHPAFRTAELKEAAAYARDALRGPGVLDGLSDAEVAAVLGRIENAHAAGCGDDPLTDAVLADLADGGTRALDREWELGGEA